LHGTLLLKKLKVAQPFLKITASGAPVLSQLNSVPTLNSLILCDEF